MDNTVEMLAAQMQDDAAVTVQNETPTQTLADVIGESPTPEQPEQEQKKPSEPGWIRQRVDAAVNKAVAATEARLRAEYDAQLAPLREAQLEREADKLVADGKISDREIALDYLRSKQGMPAPTTPNEPAPQRQRDDQGRFVSAKPTAEMQQRAAELVAQADTIYASTGVDVMNLYETDPEIKQKILSGEWTFVDVFKNTKPAEPAPERYAPPPIRSANGLGMGGADFRKMTSEQFAKVNELLESGGKIDVR